MTVRTLSAHTNTQSSLTPKYAIEVGVEKDLVNVLEVVKTAVLNGELDTAIDNAANKLREGFGK